MAIDEPARSRAPPFAFLVHQPHELGMTCDVAHVCTNHQRGALSIVGDGGVCEELLETHLHIAESQVDRFLPQLQLRPEVVGDEPVIHPSGRCDLSRRGAIEALQGEDLKRLSQNQFASLALDCT